MAITNAQSKIYICSTAQDSDLTQTGFEALTWVEVKGVVNLGETGTTTNMLNLNTWDTDVIQKAKGTKDAGSPELEVARIPTDPGQIILRDAGNTTNNYAFKHEQSDAPVGGTGTIIYNRGLVSDARRPNGGNEDFVTEIFTFGFQQKEIVVDPAEAEDD